MMHDNLANLLESNFAMMQHHKYSLWDIENMLPWERRIYIEMLVNHVKEEGEKMKEYEQQFTPPKF